MRKQAGLVALCFVAGMFGAMVGKDFTSTGPSDGPPASPAVRTVVSTDTPASALHVAKADSPVIRAVGKVGPAVVNIDTVVMRRTSVFGFSDPFGDLFGSDPFTRLVPSKGQGSGFIIDAAKGYVLTNDHVVHDAVARQGSIKVSLPNKDTYEAKVVGSDPQYDVAVLQIDGKNLPSVKLSSSDGLTIGETAIAIGNPFGFRNTVTVGVVSAIDRTLENSDGSHLEGLIQTDAAINPGNSGGPLCDIDGNVVGINTAIINGAEGLGFAMGVSSIKPVVDELIQYGRVKHGWSGMTFWDVSGRMANRLGLESTDGALVAEVYRNSPADEAGIKPGDVIVQADGQAVGSVADMQDVLRKARAGDNLSLTLVRKQKKVSIKIRLVEVPDRTSR